MIQQSEFLVLGAGVAGLAAAATLGDRAVVFEQENRPGGLVRTECFDGYWFDRVIHLLYFADPEAEARVHALAGEHMRPCPPRGTVHFPDGVVQYPFQSHLAGLPPREVMRCIRDFADAALSAGSDAPTSNYETLLLRTFGKAMCERFFFPYNRKMWKRPLASLAPSGFQWNMQRPSFETVIRGALGEAGANAYNARGWYPVPPANAECRGMEVMSRALAARVRHLKLRHRVEEIDTDGRSVVVRTDAGTTRWRWDERCMSTLPLPATIGMCVNAPEDLRAACARLPYNRVRSVALSIEGPRPDDRPHWEYYPDEALCFTRLVYMCEFEPGMAPPTGWGLLVEMTERAEDAPEATDAMIERIRGDLARISAIPPGCRIIDVHVMDADPAYVVFTPESRQVVETAKSFLTDGGVDPVGRYARWEYSSMAQAMGDGIQWADGVSATAGTAQSKT